MFQSRKFYLSLLGAVVWSTTGAETILDIIDAASLSTTNIVWLPATASALDVLALGSVTVFFVQFAWIKEGIVKPVTRGRKTLASCCIVLSIGALAVSLASIVTVRIRRNQTTSTRDTSVITSQDAHIAIWILACLSQLALYFLSLWSKSRPKLQPITISGPRDSVMSELRPSNHPSNLHMLDPTQPASPLAALPSPTFSARSSNSLQSWRQSLHHAVRPVTSRTKLIKQPSFTRDAQSVHSSRHSVEHASQADGFDTWEVDPQLRGTVLQLAAAAASTTTAAAAGPATVPSRGTALETIPGSRSVSPARALDGPFSGPVTEEDEKEDEENGLPPPPKMIPDISRPPSPAFREAHIHPLFRTESPTPPPAATPGTSIIASPLADHMIACPPRPYGRVRSNSSRSVTASPSPLVHSQSFYHERDHTTGPTPLRSRSMSPPSREMTPPIPDYVLNSSPRSSSSQSRRKVNLQLDMAR